MDQYADGIIGLNNNENSFISLLYKNKVFSKIFFLIFCYKRGYFSIKWSDPSYHKNKIEYIPMIKNLNNLQIKYATESYTIK